MADDKLLIALVRAPIVSTTQPANNEATPWPVAAFPGCQCHGRTFEEVHRIKDARKKAAARRVGNPVVG
jgi:hypothetical protein